MDYHRNNYILLVNFLEIRLTGLVERNKPERSSFMLPFSDSSFSIKVQECKEPNYGIFFLMVPFKKGFNMNWSLSNCQHVSAIMDGKSFSEENMNGDVEPPLCPVHSKATGSRRQNII